MKPYTLLLSAFVSLSLLAAPQIVPTPQYLEPLAQSVVLQSADTVNIVIGPVAAGSNPKLNLAAEFLRRELPKASRSLTVIVRSLDGRAEGPSIHLWDYAASPQPPVDLNILDRETLSNTAYYGQSYVIRTKDKSSLWVIGASDQGTLLGAMSVLQLIRPVPGGVEIQGAYIRDYPDFEFRAAADWLLNVEIQRWSLDRGHGAEAFARLCERKLDQALRFKINMVLIDGFGWSLKQRFEAYPRMMRSLNEYARARGISLIFGGYGAAYDMKEKYLGEIFENRKSYPNGPIYQCPGEPKTGPGIGHGTCRSNDALNQLKAEELRRFVSEVEPGAVYIHHEDCCGFDVYPELWKQRCDECRRRWPNDSLKAFDGGAGGFAYGYSNLIRAVNSVKNAATGYEASRDCQIILVSPVYLPIAPSSEEWSNVLELWKNVTLQLPRSPNVQIGFREIFPQKSGGEKWTEVFPTMMRRAGLPFGVFLFYLSGGDDYITDAPWSAGPAMNALFRGARTIYNFSGDFYREPMQVINAEYSWNTRSQGFFHDPLCYDDAHRLWVGYVQRAQRPPEVFGPGGIFDKACRLLYGPKSGPIMQAYYQESVWVPEQPEQEDSKEPYLPGRFHPRAYAIPSHWRHLTEDAATWSPEAKGSGGKLGKEELHRRLVRRWRLVAALNAKGADYIDKALAAGPLPEAVEDLEFLRTSFRVYAPLLTALEQYHRALQLHFSKQKDAQEQKTALQTALRLTQEARQLAAKAFPEPIDPIGGEVGTLRSSIDRLEQSIRTTSSQIKP